MEDTASYWAPGWSFCMVGFAWRSTDIALSLHCTPIGLLRVGRRDSRQLGCDNAILMYIEKFKPVLVICPISADSHPRLVKLSARRSQNLAVRLMSHGGVIHVTKSK
jgi:hypothetical protein